jgi:trans-2,3-dihydro-3-hydroxyanthranilate isomerase
LLAQLGVVANPPADGKIIIEQELGIGVLPVEIQFENSKPTKVTMTQGNFISSEIVSDSTILSLIADSFNFKFDDFLSGAPVQIAGTGVNFLIIPVQSLAVLEKCRANLAKIDELPAHFPGEFSLFALETIDGGVSKVHTRMFAPEFGIMEDPATGSAAGTLGGYLVHHGLLEDDLNKNGVYSFTIEQGDFMGRPSRIEAEISGDKDNVKLVRIGGASVVVAKGEIYL